MINPGFRSFHFLTFLLLFGITLISCQEKKEDQKRLAIARAGNDYFLKKDLLQLMKSSDTRADSMEKANSLLKSWARESILLQKAKNDLELDDSLSFDIEKQLEDYRNSLIIYAYEKKQVNLNLDTNVENSEIEEYYQRNKQNFELKDNIVKVLYVRVDKKSPDTKKIKKWYRSELEKDRILLENFCQAKALNYYLDDQTWLFFDDLLKEIPIKTYNQEQFLQNNRFIEFEDSSSIYFVNIKGFKIKNSISPLGFEKQNIKNIILNKRKLNLINEFRDNLYHEAIKNNEIEFYKNTE